MSAIDPLISFKSFQRVDTVTHEELLELDSLEVTSIFKHSTFKFGVLNWQETNKNEEDMFSNCSISPVGMIIHNGGSLTVGQQFREFLEIIGEDIELMGWEGYTGGLGNERPGTSVYTSFRDMSIMFHVAPYLPFSPNNLQQLDRKRHIGNDVALLIFTEASQPYLTSLIASQFNHVIIVVSPEKADDGTTYYSIAVTAKDEVPTFGPPLPARGIFHTKVQLRKFLLMKRG